MASLVHLLIKTRSGDASSPIDPTPDSYTHIPRTTTGVKQIDGCPLWVNGEPGAGILEFDRIEATFDEPLPARFRRSGWALEGDRKLVIGRGSECIAPRGLLPIRTHFRAQAPSGFTYGGKPGRWAAAQIQGLRTTFASRLAAERDTGLWAPYGAKQAAPPGADQRPTVPGFEQDGEGFLLRADAVAERMAVACLWGPRPGFLGDQGYAAGRGWSQAGQLSQYRTLDGQPYRANPGDCAYAYALVGMQRDAGWGPFDPEHTGNALGAWIAARDCGDKAAQFYIDLLANDLSLATGPYGIPRMARGGRAFAWTIAAFWHSTQLHDRALQMIDELVAWGFMRAPASYPFNPTPQSFGMPADIDSEQLMEGCLSDHARALGGRFDVVRDHLFNSPAPSRYKFVARGRNQTEVFARYQHPCGNGDFFFPSVPIGICLHANHDDHEVRALAMQSFGASTWAELRDILRARSNEREQTALLQSVVEQTQ